LPPPPVRLRTSPPFQAVEVAPVLPHAHVQRNERPDQVLVQCARTFSLMMAASLEVRMLALGKAPPGVFRRGLGVRAGGLVVSLP
jgi:hypothetical protein